MTTQRIPAVIEFPKVRVLARDPASVEEIYCWPHKGPWASKSGGDLWLLAQFGLQTFQNFFNYDPVELARFPVDIRGYRQYIVDGIPTGSLGGQHFHRVRQSLVQVLSGRILFRFEDVYGNKRSVVLEPNIILLIPPFMYVTYEAAWAGSIFSMTVNTLYLEGRHLHGCRDQYTEREFRELQQEFRK